MIGSHTLYISTASAPKYLFVLFIIEDQKMTYLWSYTVLSQLKENLEHSWASSPYLDPNPCLIVARVHSESRLEKLFSRISSLRRHNSSYFGFGVNNKFQKQDFNCKWNRESTLWKHWSLDFSRDHQCLVYQSPLGAGSNQSSEKRRSGSHHWINWQKRDSLVRWDLFTFRSPSFFF